MADYDENIHNESGNAENAQNGSWQNENTGNENYGYGSTSDWRQDAGNSGSNDWNNSGNRNAGNNDWNNSGNRNAGNDDWNNGGNRNDGNTGWNNNVTSGNGSSDGHKKKNHLAAKILIPVAAAAVLGTSAYFTISHFAKLNGKKEIASVETSAGEQSETTAADASASTLESSSEDAAKATLTKAGTEISSADTSATTTCLDVSEVVENVMPCVVAITDNLEYTSTYNPYNYYFNGQSGTETQETTASGSGVIIAENDQELLIVTNNHVVDNSGNYSTYTISSTGLTVQFSDGTTADATIKGTDSESDLAVIAVQLSDISDSTKDEIKIAVIGDSDEIKVGSGVIAIGNALGYGQSVTTGIISAKDREVTIDDITRTLLQTDAAINPGNSGGGLFDANGELIGINCAKTSDTSVEGMGFAIPITSAQSIIEDLMNQEPIAEEDQGYLGVYGESVASAYVTRYGYPEGVSITRIGEGSPAENAGLQIYDIITAVDGKSVTTLEELQSAIKKHAAGETVTLTVSRPDGRSFKEMEVDVTLARYDDAFQDSDDESGATTETAPSGNNGGSAPSDGNNGNNGNNGDDGSDSLFDWFFDNAG